MVDPRSAHGLRVAAREESSPVFRIEAGGGSLLGELVFAFVAQEFPRSKIERVKAGDFDDVTVAVVDRPCGQLLFVFTREPEPAELLDLLTSGHGAVTLDAKPAELTNALRALLDGTAGFVSESLIRGLALRSIATAKASRDDRLTPREQEVFELLNKGCSNAEIAGALVVSHNTVRTHLQAISVKLGVSGRTRIIAAARDRGWFKPPEQAVEGALAGRRDFDNRAAS